jgi:hypothetical protein
LPDGQITPGIRQKTRPEIMLRLPEVLRLFCQRHGQRLVFALHRRLEIQWQDEDQSRAAERLSPFGGNLVVLSAA